jgi:hypothetical protein
MVRLPPAPPRPKAATPLREILARPAFLTAAIAGAVAYGTMNMIRGIEPKKVPPVCGSLCPST